MSSNQTMSFQEWSEEIARHKRTLRYKPETLCYSDNTKRMLEELHERIDRGREAAINSLNIDVFPKAIIDMLVEEQRKLVEQHTKEMLYGVSRYVVSGECIPFELIHQESLTRPKINEKEKEKMEAKKCERCGKLYEVQDADPYIPVYFPGLPVSNWDKENYSESRIRKDNTKIISVNFRGGQVIDLCPECREKLKDFFESGKDDPNVIKKAEE